MVGKTAIAALMWITAQGPAGDSTGSGTMGAATGEQPTPGVGAGTARDGVDQARQAPGGDLQGAPGPVTQPDQPAQAEQRQVRIAQLARIEFRNDLGRDYRVNEIQVSLDGRVIRRETAPEGGELRGPITVYDGPVSQGVHRVELRAQVQGRDRRIFSYLDRYKLNLQSNDVFTVTDHPVAFTLTVDERPGRNIPFEKRPAVALRPEGVVQPTSVARPSNGAPRTVR